jgi:hypothetical protein
MKSNKDHHLKYNLLVGLFFLTIIFVVENNFISNLHWVNYSIINISAILFVPFLILPFIIVRNNSSKLNFNLYPKFMLFITIICFSLFILKMICRGDAILNIVRFLLILWSISCFFPTIFIIFNNDEPVLKSIRKAYIAGKYLRWHQFTLSVFVSSPTLAMIVFLLILNTQLELSHHILTLPTLFIISLTIPYSLRLAAHTMAIWYEKQKEFNLFSKHKDY